MTGLEQALVEPLAVARRAVRRSSVAPGDSVVIVGGGPIGQAILAWLRHLGVEDVTLSDPVADRRVLALELGATAAFDPTDELALLEAVLAGADVVFECVGRPGMIAGAMDLAAVDGRVVVVGVCAAADVIVPYTGLRKELDVRFALYYEREDFTDTIDALASADGLVPDGYVDGAIGLEELPDRFAQLVAGASGGKVIVAP
ncbi:MAG: zinc-binding dehydrogenase [Acidimicrobiales bacterium]|nr:zinc-binding dehydrogenase [Acidimicrobiales bacterium]